MSIIRVGQNHIYIYIRCSYGIFGLDHQLTIYGVCIYTYIYTVLVNPKHKKSRQISITTAVDRTGQGDV